MLILEEIKEATITGNAEKVEGLTKAAVAGGISVDDIINEGYIAAMASVGDKFKNGEFFVPEMLMAARAMNYGLKVLDPLMVEGERKFLGKVVIGAVQGDLHDIGINLVSMMLQGAGYEVINLGIDVKPEKYIEAIKKHKPQIVGLASLLTTTMRCMERTIKAIEVAGLRNRVKIIVGGAPVTQRFADEITADGYAEDAGAAVEIVRNLIM
jgi:5-methyltetrahydrofolate--homocysteine methyltransferase